MSQHTDSGRVRVVRVDSDRFANILLGWVASIDREDDQETPPGADRLINFNTTLANNNNLLDHS